MSQFEDGSQEEENDDEIAEHDESNLIDVRTCSFITIQRKIVQDSSIK
jgi:hypothetical protein